VRTVFAFTTTLSVTVAALAGTTPQAIRMSVREKILVFIRTSLGWEKNSVKK